MKWIGWILAAGLFVAAGMVYQVGRSRIRAAMERNERVLAQEHARIEDDIAGMEADTPSQREQLRKERDRVAELEKQLATLEETREMLETRLIKLRARTESLRSRLQSNAEMDKETQNRIRDLEARRAQILREVTLLRKAVAMVTAKAES